MEEDKNNKEKYFNKLTYFSSVIIFSVICTSLAVSIFYNKTMEKQIQDRDKLIRLLSTKDSVYSAVFDIKEDSVNGTIEYRYLQRGDSVLKYDEIKGLGSKVESLSDSVKMYKDLVRLITSRYPIVYNIKREEDYRIYYIMSNELDSALLLLEFYRDMIFHNEDKSEWTILRREEKTFNRYIIKDGGDGSSLIDEIKTPLK